MTGPECEAGLCLPGAGSDWFLVVLAVPWVAVAVLLVLLGLVRRQERRPAPRRGRARRHTMGSSAVTVNEIQARLQSERQIARRARKVRVVPRQLEPQATDPGTDTAPFDRLGRPEVDDDS